jgi:hypothetical protein
VNNKEAVEKLLYCHPEFILIKSGQVQHDKTYSFTGFSTASKDLTQFPISATEIN